MYCQVGNDQAKKFYERLGFEEVRVVENYCGLALSLSLSNGTMTAMMTLTGSMAVWPRFRPQHRAEGRRPAREEAPVRMHGTLASGVILSF